MENEFKKGEPQTWVEKWDRWIASGSTAQFLGFLLIVAVLLGIPAIICLVLAFLPVGHSYRVGGLIVSLSVLTMILFFARWNKD